jgi:hypothetical protein
MADGKQNHSAEEPFAIQRIMLPEHTIEGKFVTTGSDGKPQETGVFRITVPGRRVRIEHHFETDESDRST